MGGTGVFGWVVAAAVVGVGLEPPATESPPPDDSPALTVVVVVDQMPVHLLERFDDLFTGGLRRLLDRGAVYTRARQEHPIPHTSPGHATLATGHFPSSHGIVANNWWDRAAGREVSAVGDPDATVVGREGERGEGDGRSPGKLMRPTLGDRLRAARPGARVVSVAAKSRSVVLMAGADADGAYWYDQATGRFLTSRHYTDTLPGWVEGFNASGRAEALARRPWRLLAAPGVYRRSRPDSAAFENWRGGSTFPHPAPVEAGGDGWPEALSFTPWLDRLTFDLARRAVDAEALGADRIPDLLWIGASASDFIGHAFGPYSREVQDQMLRLDRTLGRFLDFLDERVGPERYVVALSADHGVVPMPEAGALRGRDTRRVGPGQLRDALRSALDSAAATEGVTDSIPAVLAYLGVYVEWPEGVDGEVRSRIRAAVAERLREVPRIVDAVTEDEVAGAESADDGGSGRLLGLYRRSLFPPRSPDIFVRTRYGDLLASRKALTAHTSPYDYDRRVPLVVLGPGVHSGRFGRDVATADLVPTLSRLLGIDASRTDGEVLEEALGEGSGTQVGGRGMGG